MHNGDGVVAAVSVHTAEMPNSMAWVSGAGDARCALRPATQLTTRLNKQAAAGGRAVIRLHAASADRSYACMKFGWQ